MKNIELFPLSKDPESSGLGRPIPSPALLTRKHLRILRAMCAMITEASKCFGEQLDDLDRRRRKRNKRQRQLRKTKTPLKVGRPSSGNVTKNF
jgi:hypothetical protein